MDLFSTHKSNSNKLDLYLDSLPKTSVEIIMQSEMIHCDFVVFERRFKCKNCGFISPTNAKRNCKLEEKDIPSFTKRVANFTKSLIKHNLTGRKHCSKQQRNERYEICKSNKCGLFKSDDGINGICAHDDCGCFIRNSGKFMDKLSWEDSKCPMKLW
jgi:hypothetical protein